MNITQRISQFKNRYSQDNPEALRNPWVIGWLLIIIVFITVNVGFILLSIITNPGLVTEDYYEQGRLYEKNAIRLMTEHNNLKWETKLETPEKIISGTPGTYRFSAVDLHGLPIKNAEVNLVAYRPSNANADFTTRLQQIAPGLYQEKISLPLAGTWDLNVKVQRDKEHYTLSHRITANIAQQ